jgi:hypothetical protein
MGADKSNNIILYTTFFVKLKELPSKPSVPIFTQYIEYFVLEKYHILCYNIYVRLNVGGNYGY